MGRTLDPDMKGDMMTPVLTHRTGVCMAWLQRYLSEVAEDQPNSKGYYHFDSARTWESIHGDYMKAMKEDKSDVHEPVSLRDFKAIVKVSEFCRSGLASFFLHAPTLACPDLLQKVPPSQNEKRGRQMRHVRLSLEGPRQGQAWQGEASGVEAALFAPANVHGRATVVLPPARSRDQLPRRLRFDDHRRHDATAQPHPVRWAGIGRYHIPDIRHAHPGTGQFSS
jgi:hypothetical protein